MTAYQFFAATVFCVIAFLLWMHSEPRVVRLQRQLHEALCEHERLQEMVAECARQGVSVTLDVINDLSRIEKEIALLRRLIEREN